MAPWISESNQTQTVHFSYVDHTVGVVVEDTLVAHAIFLNSIFVLLRIRAPHQEGASLEPFHHFPKLSCHYEFSCCWILEIKLLSNTSSQIYETNIHSSTMKFLITAMKLGICFLEKRHPEFIRVLTVSIKRGFGRRIERNEGIDEDSSPLSILEELEHTEPELHAIIHYQIGEQLWVSC